MAILRAGPWATKESDSFVDEPVTLGTGTAPVNCANDYSSTDWSWKYIAYAEFEDLPGGWGTLTSLDGGVFVGDTEGTVVRDSTTIVEFFYQAVSSWSFTYGEALAVGDTETATCVATGMDGTLHVNASGVGGSLDLSTLTFPASTTPVHVKIYTNATNDGAFSGYTEIQFYLD